SRIQGPLTVAPAAARRTIRRVAGPAAGPGGSDRRVRDGAVGGGAEGGTAQARRTGTDRTRGGGSPAGGRGGRGGGSSGSCGVDAGAGRCRCTPGNGTYPDRRTRARVAGGERATHPRRDANPGVDSGEGAARNARTGARR